MNRFYEINTTLKEPVRTSVKSQMVLAKLFKLAHSILKTTCTKKCKRSAPTYAESQASVKYG